MSFSRPGDVLQGGSSVSLTGIEVFRFPQFTGFSFLMTTSLISFKLVLNKYCFLSMSLCRQRNKDSVPQLCVMKCRGDGCVDNVTLGDKSWSSHDGLNRVCLRLSGTS